MKKNILITGASGALGKATVERFFEKGYHVIAIVSPGKKEAVLQSQDITVYEGDLTDEQRTASLIKEIIAAHKTIDAAILTVGGYAGGSLETTDGKQLHNMLAVNFETAYFVTRPIFAHMLGQAFGRIILIGARPGLSAAAGKDAVAYSLSKALIFHLAELLNAEAKSKNVVTSVIVPSTIDTPANRKAMPNADPAKWVSTNDITDAMLFLVSDEGKALREPVLKLYGNA